MELTLVFLMLVVFLFHGAMSLIFNHVIQTMGILLLLLYDMAVLCPSFFFLKKNLVTRIGGETDGTELAVAVEVRRSEREDGRKEKLQKGKRQQQGG